MIIKDTICYTKLLEMLRRREFVESINSISFKKPDIENEGFNGFIETEVTFDVGNIETFAKCYKEVVINTEIYWMIRDGLFYHKLPTN